MRRQAGRTVWVGPGDEVVVRGRLPAVAKLGRLYVFARETGNDDFSPYIANLRHMPQHPEPKMMTPLMLRLVRAQPTREISFIADFTGEICIMQEIDSRADPTVNVQIQRTICPALPWTTRLRRMLVEAF